jgi:hypothetical protein
MIRGLAEDCWRGKTGDRKSRGALISQQVFPSKCLVGRDERLRLERWVAKLEGCGAKLGGGMAQLIARQIGTAASHVRNPEIFKNRNKKT